MDSMGTGEDSTLECAEEMARTGRYDEALCLLNELALVSPSEAEIWVARANVNTLKCDLDAAITDWTRVIGLCGTQPHYFFMRGVVLIQLGEFRKAVSDLTSVIELSDLYQSDYYRGTAHLFRAEAHLKLREFDNARRDCAHVDDDTRIWTDRLRTKADILAECSGNEKR